MDLLSLLDPYDIFDNEVLELDLYPVQFLLRCADRSNDTDLVTSFVIEWREIPAITVTQLNKGRVRIIPLSVYLDRDLPPIADLSSQTSS